MTEIDHPLVGAQGEVRRTYEVAYVLDEQEVQIVKVELVESMVDEVRVEVTFLAGVDIDGGDAGLPEAVEIILAGEVTGEDRDLEALLHHAHRHLLDEQRLPGADGAHDVQ